MQPPLLQTLLGAAEFDGTAGAGLLDLSGFPLPPSNGFKPMIVTLSLDTGDESITLPQITVVAVRPGGGPTERCLMVNEQDQPGICKLGCEIGLPREPNGTPWNVQVLTPGKTVDATLLIEYTIGYFGGQGG